MKKILIVEGNLKEENQSFTEGGIKTHTESLKDSIGYFTNDLAIDVVNPSSDKNISEVAKGLEKFDGLDLESTNALIVLDLSDAEIPVVTPLSFKSTETVKEVP